MMDSAVSELIAGIRNAIRSYEEGKLGLQRLIWSIEERLSILEDGADPAWVDRIRTLSNDLEYVNAFFIESGRAVLEEDERRDVGQTVDRLKELIGDV